MKKYTVETASTEVLAIVNGNNKGRITPPLDYLNSKGYVLDKDSEGKFFIDVYKTSMLPKG